MRIAALWVFAFACGKPASRAPAVRCLPIAEATAQATRAGETNEARFRAELGKHGVEIVALANAGVDHGSERSDIAIETREIGGVSQRVLATPSYTCASGETQFAKNARGELYALQIQKRGTNEAIVACGCNQPVQVSGCGGAHVAPLVIYYSVPDELSYAGMLEIAYDLAPSDILFSGRRPDGSDCPPPEDPPP